MKIVKVNINQIKVGDKLLRFGDLMAIVSGTQITGKGYQRIFGYYENEPNNPHLLEDCNCQLDLIVEA